ncbi:MAG TPA: hypothetical protein DEF34_03850 [Desulfotomaculum sp.]|nr:MAG: hypothetical protein VR67_16175 [Peptococcaceae bacterium BRH_c8a]KJS76675.1 MAG: hypothetical protein JL56_05280 [Desulfotomaculum sp. BICA1-6]HBX22760.1 hypothetical protein [Desulfotomaculum sp.]
MAVTAAGFLLGGVVLDERYLNVYGAVDYLDEVIGSVWLKESLKTLKGYAGGGGSFGRHIDFSSCAVSAAAYYWYRAREELALDVISGQGPGLYSLQAAALGDDLEVLRGSQGLTDRVAGLKRPADAAQVIAELVIAAGYARSGRQVVFKNQIGAFGVLGPQIHVFVEPWNRSGDGHTGANQQGTAIAVVYRCQNQPSLNADCDHAHAEPKGMAGAENGALVVHCRFIARQGPRGPEIVRTGRFAAGHQPSPDIYIPSEIIMPVRD